MPPLASYYCTYVRYVHFPLLVVTFILVTNVFVLFLLIRAWITVKNYYGLTVDSAEKAALTSYINAC